MPTATPPLHIQSKAPEAMDPTLAAEDQVLAAGDFNGVIDEEEPRRRQRI